MKKITIEYEGLLWEAIFLRYPDPSNEFKKYIKKCMMLKL